MYSVVTDIERYPEFLNWCRDATVEHGQASSDCDNNLDGDTNVVASLDIAYGKLAVAFTTQNRNTLNQAVDINLLKGPFSYLQGRWSFDSLTDEASKVSLSMKFEFQNVITRTLLSSVFERLVAGQMQAFQARAKYLYNE